MSDRKCGAKAGGFQRGHNADAMIRRHRDDRPSGCVYTGGLRLTAEVPRRP